MNPNSDIFFHGGASILKPNHITRYEYPCPLHHGIQALYLQPPANAPTRSRPQGRGAFGPHGAVFLTITRATRSPPPTPALLLADTANDSSTANPLGRAMARISQYPGNTLLQSGKFKQKSGFVYVVKRTTRIPLGGGDTGRCASEEALYVIPCWQWRGVKPPSAPGHDSWCQRLHDLYNASYDRAYWCTRDTMDKYDIPAPLVEWRPRPDIDQAITIHSDPSTPLHLETPECSLCFRTWHTDSSYPCTLPCTHTLCLECAAHTIDNAGYGTLFPGERDPGRKYWRCAACRGITAVVADRADIIAGDEEAYWRYKIARHRVRELVTSWLVVLWAAEGDGWCSGLAGRLAGAAADPNEVVQARVVRVHARDAEMVMEAVPVFVAGLLDWGVSLDNPVNMAEGDVLRARLVAELRELEKGGARFHTDELVAHMREVGRRALSPVVVRDVKERLGNPVLPPGFAEYRDFLCEWTARACFMGPTGRKEVLLFMERMRVEKAGWWKDIRECWFDRGAPV